MFTTFHMQQQELNNISSLFLCWCVKVGTFRYYHKMNIYVPVSGIDHRHKTSLFPSASL